MKRALLCFLFVLACAIPSTAQFIGYTSPQTVGQKIFSGQTTAQATPAATFPCTPSNGSPCGIPNLGQSIHAVTYSVATPCVGAFALDFRLEASYDGTNYFSISEDAVDQPAASLQGSQLQGGLTAIGYYPSIRANLVKFNCGNGTPTFTANYAGTSTSTPTATGIFGQALPFRKVIVQNTDTTVTPPAVTLTTPTGNSAGTIYVQCQAPSTGASTACPSGGGLTVTAQIADSGNIASLLFSPAIAATSSLQTFTVPAFLTNRVSVNVNPSGGGGGTNWTIYYQLNPNAGSPATGTNAPFVQTTGADPCASTSVIKNSTFQNITTATTTSLVGVNGTKAIYVCQIVAQLNSSTASTVLFEYGTGAACTGPTVLSATYTNGTIASETVTFGSGASSVFATPGAVGLCAVSTVGTGPTIPVTVVYVQQ